MLIGQATQNHTQYVSASSSYRMKTPHTSLGIQGHKLYELNPLSHINVNFDNLPYSYHKVKDKMRPWSMATHDAL